MEALRPKKAVTSFRRESKAKIWRKISVGGFSSEVRHVLSSLIFKNAI